MKLLKNHIIIIAAAIMTAVVLVIAAGLLTRNQEKPIQGMVESTDYRISSKVPSRVQSFRVYQGQRVRKGDTLVILTAPDLAAKLEQAQSARDAADALAEKASNGSRRQQVEMAAEQLRKARSQREIAQKSYLRTDNLFKQGVVTEQSRDEALARWEAAVAAEKSQQAQYDMVREGARQEDLKAAKSQAGRARWAVAEVRSYVDETVLTATADGYVTEIFPEEGELVGTGAPIMNIATDDIWFTFNLPEDRLPGIEVGARLNVYIPATGKTIEARISLIKHVGNFAAWKATSQLDKYDLKVFEVQARPTEPVTNLREGETAILQKR